MQVVRKMSGNVENHRQFVHDAGNASVTRHEQEHWENGSEKQTTNIQHPKRGVNQVLHLLERLKKGFVL
jgi:hypothetical protein